MLAITDDEFRKLVGYIRNNYGICIKDEKLSLITGRLNNVLIQNNLNSFTDYYNYVISDVTGKAAIELINKITTNYTFFMREADHLDYFRNTVLPYLSKTVDDKDLRIWSAGCSTGEEPYTLAMIMDDFFGKEKSCWDTKVLATDISTRVLQEAGEGRYLAEDVANLPASWKLSYFERLDNGEFRVNQKLKKEVIFRKLNFMDKYFPFKKKFHVIFCRNVMIYFDNTTRNELVNKFYTHLEKGGYLFIGHSEALNRDETNFRYIMPAVYRKE